MFNILVTGANGQLGSEFRALVPNYKTYNFIFTNSAELNICNYKDVEDFIVQNNVQIIINCAAYTAVDKAEEEIEKADKINHLAVANLAKIAKEKAIKLVHISTDYVFDGNNHKPYLVTDATNPQGVYGNTKLAGEKAMLKLNPSNSIIIRTSWVYSSYGNNFVKTMLRLAKEKTELNIVADQIGTPTYAADLAQAILDISPNIKNDNVQTFHYSNEGVCSWYDFAKAIFEIDGLTLKANPIASELYPTPAQRPFYSVLNKRLIKDTFSVEIPHWRDSLVICLNKLRFFSEDYK